MVHGAGQSFVSLICSVVFLLLDALVASSLLRSLSLHALHNRFSMCRYLFFLLFLIRSACLLIRMNFIWPLECRRHLSIFRIVCPSVRRFPAVCLTCPLLFAVVCVCVCLCEVCECSFCNFTIYRCALEISDERHDDFALQLLLYFTSDCKCRDCIDHDFSPGCRYRDRFGERSSW